MSESAAQTERLGVTAPKGFRAAGVPAGLKSAPGYRDVSLVVNDGPAQVAAAVTTNNRVYAAPVAWTRRAVADGYAHAVVLNSGGANACTGEPGYADAWATAEHAAQVLSTADAYRQGEGQYTADDILVCSTGLIGERLPMPNLLAGVTDAVVHLGGDATAALAAAHGIMTTDTTPKQSVQFGGDWCVGGMAKGAGMLAPELATMLCVLTTDADVSPAQARTALRTATGASFDRIDSDGCMSTNDTVILLASGASEISPSTEDFTAVLTAACADLARQLIADAEGASHDIAINVHGASSTAAALAVARAVARSNLLKAAVFGNDPNWGRVLAALGTVPIEVAPFDADMVDVSINGVQVCRAGGVGQPRELVDIGANREVVIGIDLHAGVAEATVWTNDLTHDYVHENSAYAS